MKSVINSYEVTWNCIINSNYFCLDELRLKRGKTYKSQTDEFYLLYHRVILFALMLCIVARLFSAKNNKRRLPLLIPFRRL